MSDFIKRRYSDEVVDSQIVTGAGGSLAAELTAIDGLTSTVTELNKLAGVAAGLSAAELGILDGVTATAAQLNFVAGVTAGTSAASKAVVLGSDSKINTIDMTAFKVGGTSVTATAAELNLVDNKIASFTFTPAAGAANIADVVITAKDAAGATIAAPWIGIVWLSDAATGTGLTGTGASGTVQAKAASGTDFAALTAKKALIVQSLDTGIYTLEITDSAKTLFYVGASAIAGLGKSVSAQLIAGNYGA